MADEGLLQLQAELREVYQSSAKQKLSERNVIEIVAKLIDLGLIDVIYTADGKTYLTHQQLEKEIRDELTVQGGRISLSDLQQLLNVDYSHIETRVNRMTQHEASLTLVLGQLIDGDYRRLLAEDINDLLQERGHVTLVDLVKLHDLPTEFIREVVNANLGKKIRGTADPVEKDIFYTDAFVTRLRAQIRGAFSAITVPTSVGPIRQNIGCQEHLFHSVLDDLINQGHLAGMLSGSRHDKSQFLPHIYSRAQNEWVDSFYRQNGYLEYDALSRLGIPDPKDFIRKRFKGDNLVFLSSCCVGPAIFGMVDSTVEEALTSGLWCDVSSVLPSILNAKDKQELLTSCVRKRSDVILCGDSVVASSRLVPESMDLFKGIIAEKAEKSATSKEKKPEKGDNKELWADEASTGKDDKREQRRKKAAVAGSSKKEGTGGREVKTKSTKKKGGPRGRDVEHDSDDDSTARSGGAREKQMQEEQFMTVTEIEHVLEKQSKLTDCPADLISLIASKIHRPLQKEYQEAAKSIFLQMSKANQKKTAVEVQDKVNGLWTNIRLFERGLSLFEDPVQGQLVKHLLKTIGLDLAHAIVTAVAEDNMVTVSQEQEAVTTELLRKAVGSLPKTSQEPLSKLLLALNGGSLEDFFTHVNVACGPMHLGILLKKTDKKVERQLVFAHRQSLAEQLRAETDPALTLHLTSVLLFQTLTQCMVHIPGRLVPAVLQHIAPQMDQDKMAVLSNMQDLVVKQVRYKSDPEVYSEQEVQEVTDELLAIMKEAKEIGLTTKRNTAASGGQD